MNLIQCLESIVILETHECTSSVIVPSLKDLRLKCGSRQPLCARLSGLPIIAEIVAHAQKFPPICCTIQATSTASTYVHSLGSQSRKVSQQSVVPTTSLLSTGTDSATARARARLP